MGETCPAGVGMNYERIREGLPVKMPAKQVWESGGYLRGWLATCDDMEPHGELGELHYKEPSTGEELMRKGGWREVDRGRQTSLCCAREFGFFFP